MPLYTFYPCHEDGMSENFVTCELPDDDTAHNYADGVLDQHHSASQVAIWCGERKVLARHRAQTRASAHG